MSVVRTNILEMPGYVPGEQPQGGTFIKINTNECPYPPSPRLERACFEALKKGLNRYPDPMGTQFRNEAAKLFDLPVDYFMVGNGSDDILTILTRTFVGEGEVLRLPYPSYILYKSLAQLQGAQSEEIHFDENWRLTPKFSEAAPNLKLAYLPNPNSPSGTVVSREEILAIAEALPCPLVIDEAYADFSDFNCVDLVLQNKNIIVTRTLSKSYGLAGLRFGFVVAHPDWIAQFIKVKDSYNCDALSIAVATEALKDREWFNSTIAKIKNTRARMDSELREIGFETTPSHANFIWCTHPEWDLKRIYLELKSQNIFVRYMVYDQWSLGNGAGLRISVGSDPEMDVVLERIREFF
ncbi:MAG: histidinol-phosphate transaminase [Planctomycetia bacterium]|nr:histidinol-phosphate transaminase [Planctomycetia bacterium]